MNNLPWSEAIVCIVFILVAGVVGILALILNNRD